MRRKIRLLLAATALAGAVLGVNAAQGATPCPKVACVVIDGSVADPHGNPVPSYTVIAQRADGYNETTSSDQAGRFSFALPPPAPNQCYQIVGKADPFYSVSSNSKKVCSSSAVALHPRYRINGVSGLQKVYLGSISQPVDIPIDVSALSRTYPAPFAGDELPWVFSHHHSDVDEKTLEKEESMHTHHGDMGVFPEPVVRKIGDGVWQTLWKGTIHLPAQLPGYYHMDWGRHESPFNPMMDCRMVWYGFGTSSLTPATALPGTVITVKGQRLGSQPGSAVLKGSGQVTTIDGPSIVSWSDSEVKLVVPPGAKTGWLALIPAGGIKTNAQPLKIGA